MPTRHVVSQGETIVSLAVRYGLRPETIWNDPANAALGAPDQLRRVDVLHPGDVLTIPDLQEKRYDAGTEMHHVYRKRNVRAVFRLVLRENGVPRQNVAYRVEVLGVTITGTTGPNGLIEQEVPPHTTSAELYLNAAATPIVLLFGQMDPVTTPSGVRKRLRNLGLEAPADGNEDLTTAEWTQAIGTLQEKCNLPRTGLFDEATRNALITFHDQPSTTVVAPPPTVDTYRLGMDQGAFDDCKNEWLEKKAPTQAYLSLSPMSMIPGTVDTLDIYLDIRLDIHHLDVGQGESTLFALMCEKHCICSVLIDGGLDTAGGSMLSRLLQRLGIHFLDAAMISHFDADHMEGITRLLDTSKAFLKIEKVVDPITLVETEEVSWRDEITVDGKPWKPLTIGHVFLRKDPQHGVKKTEQVNKFNAQLGDYGGEIHIVEEGDTVVLDCNADRGLFKMQCLAVNRGGESGKEDDENANSIAWLLTFGKYSYYTAGDLPSAMKMQNNLEDSLGAAIVGAAGGPVTAIKCGHHGAETSTSTTFLAAVAPSIAFISAGKQESFGHPRGATLLRLNAAPSVKVVALTNCVYNRPLVNANYELYALQNEMLDLLMTARSAMLDILTEIPDTSGLSGEDTWDDERLTELVSLRNDSAEFCRARVEAAYGEFMISNTMSDATLALLIQCRDKLAALENTSRAGGATQLGRFKRGEVKLADGHPLVFELKEATLISAKQAITKVEALAREISEARGAAARRADFDVLVAGSAAYMGTVVMRMYLSDANRDNRVAFLGMYYQARFVWYYMTFGAVTPSSIKLPGDNFLNTTATAQLGTYIDPGSPAYNPTDTDDIEHKDELKEENRKRKKRSFEDHVQSHRPDHHVAPQITDFTVVFDEQERKRQRRGGP